MYTTDYMDVPKTTILAERRHKSKTERKLNCGHWVEAGEAYNKTIVIVDGDFIDHSECDKCRYGAYKCRYGAWD